MPGVIEVEIHRRAPGLSGVLGLLSGPTDNSRGERSEQPANVVAVRAQGDGGLRLMNSSGGLIGVMDTRPTEGLGTRATERAPADAGAPAVPAARVTVRFGPVHIEGGPVSSTDVQRLHRQRHEALEACVPAARASGDAHATVQIRLRPSARARARIGDATLEQDGVACIERALRTVRYPAVTRPTTLTLRLTFVQAAPVRCGPSSPLKSSPRSRVISPGLTHPRRRGSVAERLRGNVAEHLAETS